MCIPKLRTYVPKFGTYIPNNGTKISIYFRVLNLTDNKGKSCFFINFAR